MEADRAFSKASEERGASAWRDFADPEATLPQGRGPEQIYASMQKAYAKPGYKLVWSPDWAHAVGDFVAKSGHYHTTWRDSADHAAQLDGTYLTVWHRQKDGSWKFTWDDGN